MTIFKRFLFCVGLISTLFCLKAQSNGQFTLVNWNMLNYSANNPNSVARVPEFKLLIGEMLPDVLVCQEIISESGALHFLDNVLNDDSVTYSMAPFVSSGTSLDNAVYYKTAKFTSGPTVTYPTTLRPIYRFSLVPTGFADTVYFFSVHLKAGSSASDRAQRDQEVDTLRKYSNQLPPDSYFFTMGDFNLKSETDGNAYTRLLEQLPGETGNFYEFISWSGSWANAANAILHTQSPRTTTSQATIPYGNLAGAPGGMDDRFDLVLGSSAIFNSGGMDIVPGTYEAFGNSGQHYNIALIDPPGHPTLSSQVITALHNVSDHLPVRAEFTYTIQPDALVRNPLGYSIADIQNRSGADFPLRGTRVSVSQAGINVTQVRFEATGNYNQSDVVEFQLRVSTQPGFDPATAPVISNLSNPGTAGMKSFQNLQYNIPAGQTHYFYVTAQVNGQATRVVGVSPLQITY
jgi:endonuclease/exonuclease/phosphatase family metal-dependent hydrolase